MEVGREGGRDGGQEGGREGGMEEARASNGCIIGNLSEAE